MPQPLKIAVGVGGRFHAERMVSAFLRAGHDSRLFTILPKLCFQKIPLNRITSYILPEVVHRIGKKIGFENSSDLLKIEMTGRAMARFVKHYDGPLDYLISWSSFGLEAFHSPQVKRKIVVRDSAHILEQMEISKNEYERLGIALPNRDRCIERELEEYALANQIIVCSDYVRRTFIKRGVDSKKLFTLPLGVDTTLFNPKQNYSKKLPLKVVYFGNISINKGVQYLLEATKNFSKDQIELHLVGSIAPDFEPILKNYSHFLWEAPLSHPELAERLKTMDIFVTPSLQDGYGLVIPQAMAAGLCVIVTDQCGAQDLIQPGKTGFVIPSKSSLAIKEKLDTLLRDLSLTEVIGRAAASSRNTYSWKHYEESLIHWINGNELSPVVQKV